MDPMGLGLGYEQKTVSNMPAHSLLSLLRRVDLRLAPSKSTDRGWHCTGPRYPMERVIIYQGNGIRETHLPNYTCRYHSHISHWGWFGSCLNTGSQWIPWRWSLGSIYFRLNGCLPVVNPSFGRPKHCQTQSMIMTGADPQRFKLKLLDFKGRLIWQPPMICDQKRMPECLNQYLSHTTSQFSNQGCFGCMRRFKKNVPLSPPPGNSVWSFWDGCVTL